MTIYDKKWIMRLKVNYQKSLIKAFFTFYVIIFTFYTHFQLFNISSALNISQNYEVIIKIKDLYYDKLSHHLWHKK